jgi:hypothetical protein
LRLVCAEAFEQLSQQGKAILQEQRHGKRWLRTIPRHSNVSTGGPEKLHHANTAGKGRTQLESVGVKKKEPRAEAETSPRRRRKSQPIWDLEGVDRGYWKLGSIAQQWVEEPVTVDP